jgi:hypothetical protein
MEEPMVDQQERADAYYRNIVAMIWSTCCEHDAAVRDHGRDSMEAATVGNRLRSLLSTVESVEAGDYHVNCEACGKPLLDGHQVVYYDDAGSIHANCDDPRQPSTDELPSHAYDSGFTPEQCAAEIEKARAALAEVE